MMRPAPTFADTLRQNGLSLNLVRLGLAGLVLVSHAFPLGALGAEPLWPVNATDVTLGTMAVGGFFGLSGMLVTMSALRSTTVRYLVSRVLRIGPAYLVTIVLSALVVAPAISLAANGDLADFPWVGSDGALPYIVHNALFPLDLQWGVSDTFSQTPYGQTVGGSVINGSLWSLPIEIRCYVVALLVALVSRRATPVVTTVMAFLITMAALLLALAQQPAGMAIGMLVGGPVGLELLAVFLCGGIVGSAAETLPFDRRVAGGALLLFVATSIAGGVAFRTIGFGSFAVLLVVVATHIPQQRLGWLRNDLSYGSYLWAFPIEQGLGLLGGWTTVGFLATASLLTGIAATASWFLVERPALRLKRARQHLHRA